MKTFKYDDGNWFEILYDKPVDKCYKKLTNKLRKPLDEIFDGIKPVETEYEVVSLILSEDDDSYYYGIFNYRINNEFFQIRIG